MSAADYLRHTVEALSAYVPGIQPEGGGWLKLNTNENPYPPSPRVIEAVRTAANERLALYPNPTAEPVRHAAAAAFGVEPEMVIVGNGGDEVIAMIARAVLDKGDRVVVGDPTYTLVEVLVALQGGRLTRVPLRRRDFALPERFFGRPAKVIYLPNPNAPTGVLHPLDEIDRLCEMSDGVIVLDEAYADFSRANALQLVQKYSNLVIVRTLSKAYSLAGVRVGFGLAQPELVAGLMKVKDSYNVNALSQAAAVAALEDRAYSAECVRRVVEQRALLTDALQQLGFDVVPSEANFIFARPPQKPARAFYDELVARKVLVRYFDRPRVNDGLRITIGSEGQNRMLLEAIKETMAALGLTAWRPRSAS
ncbi:MAG: histidinol-phosphate transaminase [Verrucomicrobia bacterium]|nr:histidinol-phosphate transaminase [Verrucomicrobiota bacterium]